MLDCNLEIFCISESGISYSNEKYNIKQNNLNFELFSNLLKEKENWNLEGDFLNNELSIILFKIIKIKLPMIDPKDKIVPIIQYLNKKITQLEKKVELLEKPNENEIKVIPLTFANGWGNYGDGYASGKIIKKGNEITLSGLIKGTNFSTVCILPEDCRPKEQLIFSVNNHSNIMRFDVTADGKLVYGGGSNSYNWISLDGIHFFAGV